MLTTSPNSGASMCRKSSGMTSMPSGRRVGNGNTVDRNSRDQTLPLVGGAS